MDQLVTCSLLVAAPTGWHWSAAPWREPVCSGGLVLTTATIGRQAEQTVLMDAGDDTVVG